MTYKFFNEKSDPLMVGVDEETMMMLDSAHEVSSVILPGVKYIISSGRRTVSGNSVLKGAVPDSSHLSGLAVDLFISDNAQFAAIMIGLSKAGFLRYGFYYVVDPKDPNTGIPRHLHVDRDNEKPKPCIWTKREQN